MISRYPHTRFVEWFFNSFAYKKKLYHPSVDGYTDADIEFFKKLHKRYLDLGFSDCTARKEMYMMAKDNRPRVLPTRESLRGHSNRQFVGKQMVLDLHPNLLKDGDLDLEHIKRLTEHVRPVCVYLRTGATIIHQVDLTWTKQHKPRVRSRVLEDRRVPAQCTTTPPEVIAAALADPERMKSGKINVSASLSKHKLSPQDRHAFVMMMRASNPGV